MTDSEILLDLAHDHGLRLEPIEHMLKIRDEQFPKSRPRYWAFFNVGLHSKNKRLFILDVRDKAVESYHTTHGTGSDRGHTGKAEKFSNVPGSECTALGVYRCAETRQCRKHGYEMMLDGLESTNSNSRKRLTIFHRGSYASARYVKQNGKTGRSNGCVCVAPDICDGLIEKLRDGSFLIIWKEP